MKRAQIILDALSGSSAFVDDAKKLVSVNRATFDAINAALASRQGFISNQEVTKAVSEHIDEKEVAESVTRFICHLGPMHRETRMEKGAFVEFLVDSLSGTKLGFDADALAEIRARLRSILEPPPGRERQAKALSLYRRLGAHGHDFAVVCDLRPVFDDAGTEIHGLIPVTTLRFTKHDANGQEPVEIRVSQKDIADLTKQLERAMRKLAVLRGFVQSSGVALPEVDELKAQEEDEEEI